VTALREFAEAGDWDVWQEPRKTGVPVDIMCKPGRAIASDHKRDNTCNSLWAKVKDLGLEASVMIEDIDAAAQAIQPSASDAMDLQTYNSYNTTVEWVKDLAEQYSDIAELVNIGTSYEGRELVGIRITGSKSKATSATKPGFWMDGGLHAREWITTATVSYMLNEALSKYAAGESEVVSIVDSMDLLFAPILNPDGYDYTWTDDRMWRKTRMPNKIAACPGTDPNRNWDYHWGEAGTSSVPCSDSYSGASAANQPEIIAVQEYIKDDGNFAGYINFHSYSQLWMSPWGYTSDKPADYDQQEAGSAAAVAALEAVHGTKYDYGPISTTIYPASGSSADYVYGTCGAIYSYGVELRDTGKDGFLLPADQITPSGEETWAAVKALAGVMMADEAVMGEAAEDDMCCSGACTVEGEEKYYSIDTIHNMCGECCMNPDDYRKYHLFEPGLTKADNDSPCGPLGFHTYDSTVTHGFGNIKMTLDLYDPDSV